MSENKELLLKDLCARLPYGVKFKWRDGYHDGYYTFIGINEQYIVGRSIDGYQIRFIIGEDDVKPYLRPMSSMTEEEKEQWLWLTNDSGWGMTERMVKECIDFLNKKMFDYRGLIPKGQALSTEEFNPYKD